MHSSRMHTACSLPYWGVSVWEVSLTETPQLDTPQPETPWTEPPARHSPARDPPGQRLLLDRNSQTETPLDRDPMVMWPVVLAGTETPPVNRITDRCKNITHILHIHSPSYWTSILLRSFTILDIQ